MYKTILCATDFSETSIEAVRAANDLAKAFKAELILIHVVQPSTPLPEALEAPMFDLAAYENAWRQDAQKQLSKVAEMHVDPDVQTRTVVLSGHPAQTIDEYARDVLADVVVIATHGMTGWRHYLMGSVAQKVIQYTCLPVLVVRGTSGVRPASGME
jgi:universal stress protein A